MWELHRRTRKQHEPCKVVKMADEITEWNISRNSGRWRLVCVSCVGIGERLGHIFTCVFIRNEAPGARPSGGKQFLRARDD